MQLSPLQSRLVASLVASIFILALYWLICSPNLALAADLPLRSDPELDVTLDLDQPLERTDPLQPSYEPEFGLFDRSIVGRQGVEAIPIEKDKPQRFTLKPGDPACYVLSKDDIFGTSNSRKRQTEHDDSEIEGNQSGGAEELTRRKNGDSKTVYVSATTCLQPHLTNPGAEAKTPSQLKLLASVSQDTGCPTTTEGMDKKMWKKFEEGLVQMTVSPDDNPVYVNIIAPEVSEDFAGPYDFELVMSLNSSYHQYNPASDVTPSLLWMDSDSSAALLLTGSLTDDESDTDRIKDMGPPYELYVENANWPVFDGIKRSLCGIEQQSLITANKDDDGRGNGLVRTSITTRGTGNLPKQEFYFEGLNQTSNYTAVLVQVAGFNDDALMAKRQEDNNGSGNRRYIVSKPMEFQTLKGEICFHWLKNYSNRSAHRHNLQSHYGSRLLLRDAVGGPWQRRSRRQ